MRWDEMGWNGPWTETGTGTGTGEIKSEDREGCQSRRACPSQSCSGACSHLSTLGL